MAKNPNLPDGIYEAKKALWKELSKYDWLRTCGIGASAQGLSHGYAIRVGARRLTTEVRALIPTS